MSTKGLVHVATVALSFLLLAAVVSDAQSAARPARRQTTTAAKSQSSSNTVKAVGSRLEPKAMDVLKAVSTRLSGAHTLLFVATDTFERLNSEGTSVQSSKTFDISMQRPNRLIVTVSGTDSRSQFYCNDTTMMTYSGAAKAVVIAKAPPTVRECLTNAYKASSIAVPFGDLIIADPYSAIMGGLTRATYIGRSELADGTAVEVVAYSNDHGSVQMSVGTEDKLPREIRVVRLNDPSRVRHTLVLSNWRIDVPIHADVFSTLTAANDVEGSPSRRVGTSGTLNAASDVEASPSPRAVGTSGMQAARRDQRLTVHTYSSKYWGSVAPVYGVPNTGYYGDYYGNYYGNYYGRYGGEAYYQSPDGYGFYPSPNYGGYYPSAGFGEQRWVPEGAPVPGAPPANDSDEAIANFNLSLTTSGWYNNYDTGTGMGYNGGAPMNTPGQPTFVPGQIVKSLPVGCAVPYTQGPAFYLCGNTWFSGVFGPDGKLYYRVVSVPWYGY
jgi:hypothetical protein